MKGYLSRMLHGHRVQCGLLGGHLMLLGVGSVTMLGRKATDGMVGIRETSMRTGQSVCEKSEPKTDWSKTSGDSSLPMAAQSAAPLSPTSNQHNDGLNRPTGSVPSGQPSVAGGSGANESGSKVAIASSGKISSTYPPIFYARPGESWEDYWRSVMFWLASEGKSIPSEMQGPRLMQQLRERAAKIVQHLTVGQVSSSNGIHIIKQEMEKSPIIRILDNKKIDKRRQKFMRLARLPNESMESFINRAEIYRRENETSPAYSVELCFYVGHFLDSAKLTRKDFALLKALCGGNLDDEARILTALLELAEHFEGLPHCPIGRGEPQLDNEDKYLVQKPGQSISTSSSTPSIDRSNPSRKFHRGRGGRFSRRRFRDALVAILEDEDAANEEDLELGDESVDEEVEDKPFDQTDDITEFSIQEGDGVTGPPLIAAGDPLAEIYAQEYKARN